MESKRITVLLNLNPKYLHKDLIKTHVEDLLSKNVLNFCFPDLGKIIRIDKIISIGIGKIHNDTGFSKTPVTFEAKTYLPKIDQIVKGTIEKYDTNGGIYVNYNNIISVFCLNTNLNNLFNKNKKESKCKTEKNIINNDNDNNKNILGVEVDIKITKVNFNEQNMIVIGKII